MKVGQGVEGVPECVGTKTRPVWEEGKATALEAVLLESEVSILLFIPIGCRRLLFLAGEVAMLPSSGLQEFSLDPELPTSSLLS